MSVRKAYFKTCAATIFGLSALMAASSAFAWTAVTPELEAQVKPGMSKEEVHKLLGEPLRTQGYSRIKDTTCTFVTDRGGSVARLYVYFDKDGLVASTGLKSS